MKKMYKQLSPEEQQMLYQQQMMQYAQENQYAVEDQDYDYEQQQHLMYPENQIVEESEQSYTPGTRYSTRHQQEALQHMQNMYSGQQVEEEEEEMEESVKHSSYHRQSTTSGKDDNFKVIIRVRPPLPREQDSSVPFRSILHIASDNKGVSLMEYMGAEVDEAERQIDIQENPQL